MVTDSSEPDDIGNLVHKFFSVSENINDESGKTGPKVEEGME